MFMFQFIDQISLFFRQPFMNVANSMESIPIIFAFLLGIVGALAPCQFTGNVSAITLYGANSLSKGVSWRDTFFFILGKIAAFSGLGLIVFLFGKEFQQMLPLFFEKFRLFIGPILLFIGAYMLGLFRLNWTINLWKYSQQERKGNWGAFMLGFSFSLAFCPTMFLLFFLILMPVTVSTSYGIILPSLFAIGTSVPFLFVILLIWYFGLDGKWMKKGRKFGLFVQRIAGMLIILLGIFEIIVYW